MVSQETTPLFQIRALCKTYRTGSTEVRALQDIDLDIYPGEFIVLLGPSGSGKSTLLNILGGLDRPSSGSAHFADHELNGASDDDLTRYRREHVGFVFQFYNLMPSLTVRENVELVTDIAEHPMPAAEALQLVGLGDRLDHFPSQLSGGERQMLAVARALMTDPEMLLMDEPTEGLAPVMVQHLEEIVAELGKTGLGILLVEQNLYSALSVAHEVYLMETGEIVHHCLADELMNDRDTMQRFLGVR